MKFINHYHSPTLFEIPIILNYFSKKLLLDISPFQNKDNDLIITHHDNINVNDSVDNYLLKSINYRLDNIERNNNSFMNKNSIKNQKIRDIIIILKIYKNHLEKSNKEDDAISLIKKNLNDKTEWLNRRIINNNKKLLNLIESYKYYSKYISEGSKTKKMLHVKNKMHEHYNKEIGSVKNRIKILNDKLSMLSYFKDNIEQIQESSYINKYIKVFIDDNLNENNNVKSNLNEVLLYLNYISGKYYDDIKLTTKTPLQSPSNTNMICEIRALSSSS
jgi:hypothetical protein